MLKAYDYVENSMDRTAIQDSARFNEELKLAKNTVERVLQMEMTDAPVCPGCQSTNVSFFFEKWGVSYLRCETCGTIFVQVGKDTLEAYQTDTALTQFRNSEEYQEEARQKRQLSWQELVDWIVFRSYRYHGKKDGLHVVTGGDRHLGFAERIKDSAICKTYTLLKDAQPGQAEIALSFNLLQQTNAPREHLTALNRALQQHGLLFLSARIGTGFDILALKEYSQIYPYEYVSLLSKAALEKSLEVTGFELLDFSTPGSMDVSYVRKKQAYIAAEESFIRTLMRECDERSLGEFQRFLQKSGMSSYAHIVAKKVEER